MDTKAFLAALGRRVRELRERKGVSQYKLATASGIAVYTLQKLEKGQANSQIGSILKICDALDIQVVELFEDLQTSDTAKDKRNVVNRIARLCTAQDLETAEAIEKVVKAALTSGLKVT